MKKAFLAIILTVVTLTSTPVHGAEIASVEVTETGSYITFDNSTGYYLEGVEVNANSLYLLAGIVTDVTYDNTESCDLVTMESMNGDLFQWFTDCGDWTNGDCVTCIMNNNNTEDNTDDSVIGAF